MEQKNTFQNGQTYTFNYIGDSSARVEVRVLKRTAKFVTIKMHGEDVKRCKVFELDGAEAIRPQGSYSMAPICRAN